MPLPDYPDWAETCDTLHAHTQLLGKLAGALAPFEPSYQHIALRLTARGWETAPLPWRGGSVVVALDLRRHEAVISHSLSAADARVPLAPDRAVADVTADVLSVLPVPDLDLAPDEVPWTVPLDQDRLHATYDEAQVSDYFAVATQVALVLADWRAPHAGRSTPVNAWWGSFDVAASLFGDDGTEVAVGWWPGDAKYPRAALYAYAKPAPEGYTGADLGPGRWNDALGEFILDWSEVCVDSDPNAVVLAFARGAAAAAGLRTGV
jgi:hypothetical protein